VRDVLLKRLFKVTWMPAHSQLQTPCRPEADGTGASRFYPEAQIPPSAVGSPPWCCGLTQPLSLPEPTLGP